MSSIALFVQQLNSTLTWWRNLDWKSRKSVENVGPFLSRRHFLIPPWWTR